MASVDGIAELHMSGARAVFGMERGETLDEEQIAAAFEAQGMKLERVDRVERPRPKGLVTVDTGIT